MRDMLKTILATVVLGTGLVAVTTAAKADIGFGINIGPPGYYYAPPPPVYNAPGHCYWDSMGGRVCTD